MKAVLAALMLSLTGCAVNRDGVTHHVIVGFGVVSVPKTNVVAHVTRVKAVGLYAGSGSLWVGAASQLTTTVQTNANVIIEVK